MESKTPNTPEMIDHMLHELEHPAKTLTSWELDFLTSVRDQFDRKNYLTDKQFTILERVYAEKTA